MDIENTNNKINKELKELQAKVEEMNKERGAYEYKVFNILNISENLSTIKEKHILIRTIIVACKGLVQCKYLMFFTHKEESNEYEFSDERSLKKEGFKSLAIPYSDELKNFLKEAGKKVSLEKLKEEKLFAHNIIEILERLKLRHIIPLFLKDNLYGFMIFSDKINKKEYTSSDIELLSIIGNQTIIAVDNINLFDKTRIAKEQLEKAYKELKDIDKLKDNFMALISHELYTPLTVIIAAVDGLKMVTDIEPDELEFLVTSIDESASRLKDMVDKIVLLSKLDATKVQFGRNFHNINNLITDTINKLEKKIAAKKQKVEFNPDKNIPLAIGDAETLSRVFEFIIDNAIEFSPENTGHITIKAEKKDDKILVSISDNGIGIKEDNMEKIFERFEQEIDIMAHGKGIGLSLPICKEIIEIGHKNKIWCESEVGKGSTFYFTLDITDKPENKKEIKSEISAEDDIPDMFKDF